MKSINRRKFLHLVGVGAGVTIIGCSKLTHKQKPKKVGTKDIHNEDLEGPSSLDDFQTIAGIGWYPLISWGDIIKGEEKFGFNNDFTAYIPINGSDEGFLWVNHEEPNPLFLHGVLDPAKKEKSHVLIEKQAVGGSILHIKKNISNQYELVKDSPLNRRITASTPIPFDRHGKVFSADHAVGTLANCGGGVTPWGTILTCEENYNDFFGEWDFKNHKRSSNSTYGWEKHFNYSPVHYGWVVEVNPQTGKAEKRISLGRFKHESATVSQAKDGTIVVYMGDDEVNQCLYKFISDSKDSLLHGTLYVANLEKGEWISLNYEHSNILKSHFDGPVETLARTREAAHLLGGTPLDRPEDIEVDQTTKTIFLSLSNNKDKGNYFGSILKIVEENGDPRSKKFKVSTFLEGGQSSGIACPDNLCLDKKGNLWITSDFNTKDSRYEDFGNNGLFIIPSNASINTKALQVASAPNDAEITGLSFSPDFKTAFVSVQHPGENSVDILNLTSRWPSYSELGIPKPTVICLYGPYLNGIL